MQKRFTPRDYILFALLAVLFCSIILTMYQIDRQWAKLAKMETSLSDQARDMRELRKAIKSGAISSNGTNQTGDKHKNAIPAAFKRAYAMTQKADYAEGDWSVRALNSTLKTITPLVSSDYDASILQGYVLETLLRYNPGTLEIEGLIANSWTISEDGLVYTFKLRDDVRFSDGNPLTANDVVFTYNFLMNEKIAAPRHRSYFSKVSEVKALDKYTVRFTYKEPYYNSLMLAGELQILPKHYYEKFLQEPTKFNKSKGYLLGSGPYRLKDNKEWSPVDGLVEFERNPRYWGAVTPSYEKLIWKIIVNDSARLTTFRNEDIDLYGARPIEYKKLVNDKQIKKISRNFEYTYQTAGYTYIGWNQLNDGKPTRFANETVREAMTYIIDRQKIIDEIYSGYGDVAKGPFNPLGFQHNPKLSPRPYDLNKAKELLSQAGYQDRDGDGVIEDEAGKPFKFELIYFRDSDDYKRLSLLLKDMLAKAGIVVELKPTEWPVMLEKTDNKKFDAMMLAWSASVESDLYQIFHSSQTLAKGNNFINYKSKKLDKLIEQARSSVNKEERIKLWRACEQVMYDEQPYTFLMRRKSLAFVNKRLQNLTITKFGLNTKEAPIETYVPLSVQKYTK